ncbi:MAG TPA: hypothetical protein VGC75_03190, partial [Candidatus Nitrosocosmicus sp.]
GLPTSSNVSFFQCSGTVLINVIRLLGPTISTAALKLYCGSRVIQLKVAKPPKLPPNTPILLGSIQSWDNSHFIAYSRSFSSLPPQS